MVFNKNHRLLLVIGIGYNNIAGYWNIKLNRMVIDGEENICWQLGNKYKADELGDVSLVIVL